MITGPNRHCVYTCEERNSQGKGVRGFAIAVAVGLITGLFVISPAFAADTAACAEPEKLANFKGFNKNENGAAGIEAELENQTLGLCVGSGDNDKGSAVFVAISNASHPNGIAQVGLYKCVSPEPGCTGSIGQFYAWGRHSSMAGCAGQSNVPPTANRVGGLPGGTWAYEVVRTANLWKFKINGVVVHDMPAATICWARERLGWIGESWDPGDAIGGASDNPFRISNALYQPGVGGQWLSPSWHVGAMCNVSTGAKYKCNAPNGQAFDLWTEQ